MGLRRQTFRFIIAWVLISLMVVLADGRPVGDRAGFQSTDRVHELDAGMSITAQHTGNLVIVRRLKGAAGPAEPCNSPGNGNDHALSQQQQIDGKPSGSGQNVLKLGADGQMGSGSPTDTLSGNQGLGGPAASNDGKPENSGSGSPGVSVGNGNLGNSGSGNSGASGSGKPDAQGYENVKPGGPKEVVCNSNTPQCAGGNPGDKPAGARPRGDDPRPRAWGKENNRGETVFDDRKSPRTVAFLGRSANVRIYPNYSEPDVYLQLRFGKIQELDRTGRPVPGHKVPSLAAATTATFTSGNTTINGVNMSYVNVSLNPLTCPGFTLACRALGGGDEDRGGGAPSPSMPLPSPFYPLLPPVYGGGYNSWGGENPQLTISLLFGLDDALTLPYGDVAITVPRNGLKWTVSLRNWPFCDASNTLSVSLDLLLAGNESAQIAADTDSAGAKQLQIVLGAAYNSSLSFLDYALDGAAAAAVSGGSNRTVDSATKKMPVTVSLGQDGGVTSVVMGLPNPAAYNVTSGSVWYDPTQTTTSIYLAVNDMGNADVRFRAVVVRNSGTLTGSPAAGGTTGEAAGGGSTGGAAKALRATLWTAIAAVLLGVFFAGSQQQAMP